MITIPLRTCGTLTDHDGNNDYSSFAEPGPLPAAFLHLQRAELRAAALDRLALKLSDTSYHVRLASPTREEVGHQVTLCDEGYMECTCPIAARGKDCDHMAAVARRRQLESAYERQPPSPQPRQPRQPQQPLVFCAASLIPSPPSPPSPPLVPQPAGRALFRPTVSDLREFIDFSLHWTALTGRRMVRILG